MDTAPLPAAGDAAWQSRECVRRHGREAATTAIMTPVSAAYHRRQRSAEGRGARGSRTESDGVESMGQQWRLTALRGVAAVLGLAGGIAMVAGPVAPAPAALAQDPESWSQRAPMLLPRSEASVADLNGKIYVIGGYPGTRLT